MRAGAHPPIKTQATMYTSPPQYSGLHYNLYRLCYRLAAVRSMFCTHELRPLLMHDRASTFFNFTPVHTARRHICTFPSYEITTNVVSATQTFNISHRARESELQHQRLSAVMCLPERAQASSQALRLQYICIWLGVQGTAATGGECFTCSWCQICNFAAILQVNAGPMLCHRPDPWGGPEVCFCLYLYLYYE
jgi:hypothetical protein